jgi:hypothetical protein
LTKPNNKAKERKSKSLEALQGINKKYQGETPTILQESIAITTVNKTVAGNTKEDTPP